MSMHYGRLLRQERLRQNLSQEGLCRGICTPSYLSKIEQGQVEPGEDILQGLFAALGLRLETDPGFLKQAQGHLNAYFSSLEFGLHPEAEEALAWLQVHRLRLLTSPLYEETALALLQSGNDPDAEELLASLASGLSEMPLARLPWYHLGAAASTHDRQRRLELLKQAQRLYPRGLTALELTQCLYELGRYAACLEGAAEAYRLGAEEGNVFVMSQSALLAGTAYANQGCLEEMFREYNRVLALAQGYRQAAALRRAVSYNTGATLLENGQAAEALPHLLKALEEGDDDALTHHKLCLAYIDLGDIEHARRHLDAARAQCSPEDPPLLSEMLDLAQLRMRADFGDDPAYDALLHRVYRLSGEVYHFGFKRFYGIALIQLLTHQRRYKEALAVTQEIS